jgi:hypothetical protein
MAAKKLIQMHGADERQGPAYQSREADLLPLIGVLTSPHLSTALSFSVRHKPRIISSHNLPHLASSKVVPGPRLQRAL